MKGHYVVSTVVTAFGLICLWQPPASRAEGVKAEAEVKTDATAPATTTHTMKKESATVETGTGSVSKSTKSTTAEVGSATGDTKAKTSTSHSTTSTGGVTTGSGVKAEAEVQQ